jgi:GTP-binding protein LepA
VTDGGQADSPGVWGPVGLGDYSGASMSYPLERIRNFAIIAHVDHGKSTLADRMLQLTKLVEGRQMRAQYLDKMDLERERGITIKAQAVRMPYQAADGSEYLLNLIDTPGHVDFSYEVSRAMNACEGAVLLVDAAQGMEAQTIANLYVAIEAGLEVIPVLNKIDLPAARPEQVAQEIASLLGGDPEDIIAVSAKTGANVPAVLERIVERVPAPKGDPDGPLRALIFDSVYDSYRGVLAYVRVVDGVLRPDQDIRLMATGFHNEVDELAVISPEPKPVDALGPGEVGYLTAAIKEVDQARVGDTVTDHGNPTPEPLPGYREPTPMVYSGMYPLDSDDFPDLRDALEKLRLNDASFTFEPETSVALGFGFRCGFLGLLHMEIISERLSREFDIPLVATAPNVAYEVHLDDKLRKPIEEPVIRVSNPAEMPPPNKIDHVLEPVVEAMILCPSEYVGAVMQLCEKRRGVMERMEYLTEERVELRYTLPLAEIIFDFFDRLKSATRGYASLDYEPAGMRRSELAKVDILLHGDPVDAFSAVVHRDKAYDYGKRMVSKLRELIPRQQFDVPVQAAIGSKIIARETIKAFRKDVTAGLYGGDVTRKRKLLERQKAGKKRMKSVGSVEIPQEAFIAALSVGDS